MNEIGEHESWSWVLHAGAAWKTVGGQDGLTEIIVVGLGVRLGGDIVSRAALSLAGGNSIALAALFLVRACDVAGYRWLRLRCARVARGNKVQRALRLRCTLGKDSTKYVATNGRQRWQKSNEKKDTCVRRSQ